VLRADNLTTFLCRLSGNLGASTSWNPQGLSRPVMGLLYICKLDIFNYGVRNLSSPNVSGVMNCVFPLGAWMHVCVYFILPSIRTRQETHIR
jgi:hypothetical protein